MSEELPRGLKIVTVWLLVGVLLFLGVEAWQHRARQARFSTSGDVIEIRRGPDGHYHWPGAIEGRAVDFLVDTGATGTAISSALARDLGLRAIDTVKPRADRLRAMYSRITASSSTTRILPMIGYYASRRRSSPGKDGENTFNWACWPHKTKAPPKRGLLMAGL